MKENIVRIPYTYSNITRKAIGGIISTIEIS